MQPGRFLSAFGIVLVCGLAGRAQQPTQQPIQQQVTLNECIQMALVRNLDIQIQRFGPDIAEFNLGGLYGAYDPVLSAGIARVFNSQPSGVNTEGQLLPSTEITQNVYSQAPTLSGQLPFGMSYSAGLNVSDQSFQPQDGSQYNVGFNISAQQELLRNFWINPNTLNIRVSKKMLEQSELTLRQQIMTTVTLVEEAYYGVIAAAEFVQVQQKALELAERLLAENRKKVEVGALAPLDEKQAQSQVATSRADLLAAQRALDTAENALKNLVTDNYSSLQKIDYVPASRLAATPTVFSVQDSWLQGLTMRPDLQNARVNLERQDIEIAFDKNQLLPTVSLFGSYGRSAVDNNGYYTNILTSTPSFGPAFGRIADNADPNYSFGLRFSMPLGNRAARNSYRASLAAKQQGLLQFKKLEQSIMVEIDNAISTAKTGFDRVTATREAVKYSEAALEAEQKKLENGKSTSFFVLQFQRDLTSARSAEIRALADYNIALARLALAEGSTLNRHNIQLVGE